MQNIITIQNLHVSIKKTKILNGIDLSINKGEIHAIMGPNGSGKSTLAMTIMGHPNYIITDGSIMFNGKSIIDQPVEKRAQSGIFLAFQNPVEIEGVTLKEFLYHAYQSIHKKNLQTFEELLIQSMQLLDIKPAFVERSVNFGLSGGEKKRAEMLQLAVLQPKFVILDEIDSGLDVDALQVICKGLLAIKEKNKDMAMLVITHYPRILHYLEPDVVHVMKDGVIAQSGGKKLAETIEAEGYR